jgi:hypothetical protein
MHVCGAPEVDPGEDTSRLDFEATVYDVSVGDYSDAYDGPTFYIADGLTEFVGTAEDRYFIFEEDILITPAPLVGRWDDPEDDPITVTYQDALPAGLSLVAEELTGTPTTCGTTVVTERATSDVTGEFAEEEITIAIGKLVPDVVGDDELTATTAIEALCSITATAGTAVYSETVPVGLVVSTTPISGTLVEYNSDVTYFLSLGPAPASDGDKNIRLRGFLRGMRTY